MSSDGPEYDDGRCPGCGKLFACTCPKLSEKYASVYEALKAAQQQDDQVVLTDEFVESIEDAIEDAMAQHEPLRSDSICSCGTRNNMDGDVLFSHRVSAVTTAVRHALGLT